VGTETPAPTGAFEWMRPLYTLPTGLSFNADTGAIDGTVYETTYSESGAASDVTVTTQANLQTEINSAAARAGLSIIRIAPSSTITGQTTLKARSQVGWTYIISTQLASLPSITAGNVVGTVSNRVAAANVTNMPIFELGATNGHHFDVENGATNYYLRGLAFKNTTGYASSSFIELFPPTATVNANYPDEIVIQQCYFHSSSDNVRRAIQCNTRRVAIMDNYCDRMGDQSNESQWLVSTAGVGPYRIVNNYSNVGGTSENIMFGGSALPGSGETFAMADIEVRGELWTKPTTGYGGTGGNHKNHFEIKTARRVLVEGCIARVHNGGGQQFSVNIKLSGSSSAKGWCQDVTVRFLDVSQALDGIVVSGTEDYTGSNIVNRIEFCHNLVRDLNGSASNGHAFRLHQSITNVDFHHNTLLAAASGNDLASCLQLVNSGQRTSCRVQYNIMAGTDATPTWNVKSADGFGEGETAFSALVTTGTFASNLCVATGSLYPNQTRVANRAAILFTNLAGDDYTLQAGSPAKGADPNGHDYGANMTLLNAAIAGVE